MELTAQELFITEDLVESHLLDLLKSDEEGEVTEAVKVLLEKLRQLTNSWELYVLESQDAGPQNFKDYTLELTLVRGHLPERP